MIDGSRLSFSENCSLTRSVVELAAGVSVEGELVHVAHNEEESDITRFYTDPETAKQFVSETGVDALAVAVGTAHGFYRGKVRIDFDRLSRIRDSVGEAALVLHGGSGVSDELLARAIDSGIAKINFGTELKNAFTRALRSSLMASDFRNGTSHLPRTCGQRSFNGWMRGCHCRWLGSCGPPSRRHTRAGHIEGRVRCSDCLADSPGMINAHEVSRLAPLIKVECRFLREASEEHTRE